MKIILYQEWIFDILICQVLLRVVFLMALKKTTKTIKKIIFVIRVDPGNVLLSHGEAPYYHRRCASSLPSSIRDRVVPTRYGCQEKNLV